MVFGKLFGWGRNKAQDPRITFGRYSDNNKTVEKVNKWAEADALFKQKDFHKSIDAFFEYLRDDTQQNVVLERNEREGRFRIFQGSKMVRGEFNNERLWAETTLARMPEPHVPAMRRLLEMNFNLYYSRYSLNEERICMKFDSDLSTANPNKLYYGLKELATKSDKQDDLLINEFPTLQPVDTEHIFDIPDNEKEIKYEYLQKWIRSGLDHIQTLDPEKFSGAISYLLLALSFRIDYLIAPEGKILQELEKIVAIYYTKDDKPSHEKNPAMIEGFKKLLNKSKEEVFPFFFRSKHTFAIVTPHNHKQVSEALTNALENMKWYRDNSYTEIANRVMEYGFAFAQYSYSLPKPLSDLFRLFMQVNFPDYFRALGFANIYYDPATNHFDSDEIVERIQEIIQSWKRKYPSLAFKTKSLNFNSLLGFNYSFTQEIAELTFE